MINFFTEDIEFPLKQKAVKTLLRKYINELISGENKEPGDINFIFCNNEYLLEVNRQYLKHDYYTDVITFDYSEHPKVSGDIFISVNMVLQNADKYAPSFEHELYRVIFHGVLHLCGYKDKSADEEEIMRGKENYYLNLNEID